MARKAQPRAAAPGRNALSIGALSRATRIPVETLRTWELRYGAPKPGRKPSGHRVYSAATVEHLRRVGRLLARGHRPGEILSLPVAELDRLLALTGPSLAPSSGPGLSPAAPAAWVAARIDRLLVSAHALDREGLVRQLEAGWARLGPLRFLEDMAGEFLRRVGEAWADGTLDVRHEHVAYACVSDFIRCAREPFDERAQGPRVVAAALPGERHEGGLVLATALLAVHGYRVLYLGLDTPVEQLAAAARLSAAGAVVVSVSAAASRARARRELEALRRALPRRVPVWLGGSGAPAGTRGVEHFASLSVFDARLRREAA